MTEIKVHYVEEHERDFITLWNEIAQDKILSPLGFYEWKRIAEKCFGVKVFAILARSENGNRNGIAFLYFSPKENVLYSFRHGFYADDEEIAEKLRNEILLLANRNGVQKTLITSGLQQYEIFGTKIQKECLYLPLSANTHDDLWETIPKKTKNMIRKAEKAEYKISLSWDELEKFHDVYADRFTEKSLGIKPLSYFRVLKNEFQDNVILISAVQGNDLVGGMVFILSEKIAYYAYNASVVSAANNGVNNLLMWEAMKTFHAKGIEIIDLSESKPDSPVHQFKSRLSKDIIPKTIYYYELPGSGKSNISVFIRQKISGILQRLMPCMPRYFKRKYLEYLGGSGRVL